MIGEKKGLGNSLNNIGNIYGSQRNYPRALEYYTRSLAVREEMRDDRRIAASLNNFGVYTRSKAIRPARWNTTGRAWRYRKGPGTRTGWRPA